MSPTPTPETIRAYDRDAPDREATESATFGLGCFWGPDAQFGAVEGVVRTRVGYAGGTRRDPTYRSLGDHTEVLQVDYRPDRVSYADLLDRIVRSHDPRTRVRTVQYQNVVLPADDDQRATVESFLADRELDPASIETRIEELSQFHVAEPYHQKHALRSDAALLSAFERAGHDDAAIRESPAAAKLNAHVRGYDVPERELGLAGTQTRS